MKNYLSAEPVLNSELLLESVEDYRAKLAEEITHNITKGLSNNSIAELAGTLDYKTCEGICRDYFGNQYDELPYFKGRK